MNEKERLYGAPAGDFGILLSPRTEPSQMEPTTFMVAALALSAVALLANVLLWVPIFGKAFYLIGKILRIVGIAVGVIDVWAILAFYDLVPVPI